MKLKNRNLRAGYLTDYDNEATINQNKPDLILQILENEIYYFRLNRTQHPDSAIISVDHSSELFFRGYVEL